MVGGKSTCVLFIDLNETFDTVDHETLLRKLVEYGIRGMRSSFRKSYPINRQYCTNSHALNFQKCIALFAKVECCGVYYENALPNALNVYIIPRLAWTQ